MSNYRADHTASGIVDGSTPWTRDDMVHLAKQYLFLSKKTGALERCVFEKNREIKELEKLNGDQAEYIARLKAVIAEIPEFVDGATYEHFPDGSLKNIIKISGKKSDLLKKHGVEV